MSTEKEFLRLIRDDCKVHGIRLDLRRSKYIKFDDTDGACGGYFDETDGVLVVAMKNTMSFEILVHEYCHMQQWKENTDIWKKSMKSLPIVWSWLEGTDHRNISKHVAVVRDMELDCERRAVKLIKKYDLKIDTKLYTKRANAYVLYYNWLLLTRKWCTKKNSPYRNKKLLDIVSDRFNMNYSKLSESVTDAFRRGDLQVR